ncbi:hypothetical protein BGZ95_010738 [Linnemannia exigua]|uniref:Uncharacterized protein n=1 Tax=Linnemannia exigua TaxID=604196 RepID=A0AAD4H652_9FUNG|nr:hypothetical protein BGZ95_010738 [Linnemannia exigua]
MNRDQDPTQVIGSPATPTPSSAITICTPPPAPLTTTPSVDPLAGLSKIKQTALLLKQKVAGTNNKPQKQPNKIAHPFNLTASSRSSSFPSPNSPSSTHYSNHNHHYHGTSSSLSSPSTPSAHSLGHGGGGKLGIKAMIAAREDPSLSCNKMAPPGTQPLPAPQKREPRAGMTKVQLSLSQPPTSSSSSSSPSQSSSLTTTTTTVREKDMQRGGGGVEQLGVGGGGGVDRQDQNDGQRREKVEDEEEKEKEARRQRRQSKRDSIQAQQQQRPPTPTTPVSIAAGVLESIPAPEVITTAAAPESTTTTDIAGKRSSRRRNGGVSLIPSQFSTTTTTPPTSSSSSSSASPAQPAFMKAFEDIRPIETNKTGSASEERPLSLTTSTSTTSTRSPLTSALLPPSPSLASPPPPTAAATVGTTGKTKTTQPASPSSSVFDRPTMSPRRHTTTNSPSSPLTSSPFVPTRHLTPPVPVLPATAGMTPAASHHQPINPTLRQLQTPNIPTNLVQARILQQEEQKRKDEELAKIPITANLRTVKKIQAVLVSDDEDDDPKARGASSSGSSSASSSLSAGTGTRPRSKTTSTTSVPVSMLVGGKRRGDRNHVEPVAIPKRLADQVEHILGRKLAGKGSVLDEREKEREEEEARKAAEPLPPIVLGKPRKRAMTSAHIRNLVSSWDIKVEEAKELTSEAEKIRLFLEERSTAHAEMPKPKHAPTAEELLRPLPALPPPPSPSELHQLLANGGVGAGTSSSHIDAAGGSVGRRRGRTVATSTGSSGKSFGHVKGASVASASPSTTFQPLQKTKILLTTPSQSSFVATVPVTSSKDKIAEESADVLGGQLLGLQLEEDKKEKDTTTEARTRRPTLSADALDTTKRTGEMLVSKAAINRPRRKRNPTLTQEAL